MQHRKQYNRTELRDQGRSAFTLTEMLVATVLVVLIMLMFAQIYGSAVGSIREQRGLATNDQKARSLETVIRQDLQRMTFREPAFPYGEVQGIVPLVAGDDPIVDPVNQRGYFFYAENVDNNDTDDILQFTIQVAAGQRGDVDDRIRGNRAFSKAADLGSSVQNQPASDNGSRTDGLGSSRAAEVVYFMRGNKLYRRVLLLRDKPLTSIRENTQPTSGTERRRVFHSGNRNYTANNFYDDFDYAATRRGYNRQLNTNVDGSGVLWFHSVDSLDNTRQLSNWPIAVPHLRYGFNPITGASVETISGGGQFNRFTLEECSHNDFLWPGTSPSSNPYIRSDLVDIDGDNTIDEYAQGNRFGEDIIATNVEAFDVEGFDVSSNDFVDASSDFDTWHPHAFDMQTADPIDSFSLNSPTFPGRELDQTTTQPWSASVAAPQFIRIPALQNGVNGAGTGVGNTSMIYRRIQSGTTGTHRPEFPPIPGTIVRDGTAYWECVDNRVPLKALRITVRLRDPGSDIPRQITIVHSFVE